MSDIWAVIPVKEFDGAKHRLSSLLVPSERRLLAETMLTDMLEAVTRSRLLAGVLIVTLDPHATALGEKNGARIGTAGRAYRQRERRSPPYHTREARWHDHNARRHSSHPLRRD